MAVTTIKTTYALDIRTVKELEDLASKWEVSKSEALRRAIHKAASREFKGKEQAFQALERLQQSLKLPRNRANSWIRSIRVERKAISRKRHGR